MSLQHKRSSIAHKRPVATSLNDGQLALNINATSPGVFFKNSSNVLTKVGPVHVGTSAPNSSPATGGSTGNSIGEQWLDTTGGTYVLKIWDGTAWRSDSGTFVEVSGDTMTGALVLPSGTEAVPALGVGFSNNGLYMPATDELGVSTSGSERLRIDSSGDVGIGTTNPAAKLEISALGSGYHPAIELTNTSGDGSTIRSKRGLSLEADYENNSGVSESQIVFKTDSLERMRIDSSGVVTINSGFVTLNGNNVGGIKVTIADDAFAEITPPRAGAGFIAVTEGPDEVFPNAGCNGFVYCDWGDSPTVSAIQIGGLLETSSQAAAPTGTTGSDDHATLFAGGTSGKVYLENRLGTTGIFALTFT